MAVGAGILVGGILGGVAGGLLGPDNSDEIDELVELQRQAQARRDLAVATGNIHHFGSNFRAVEAQRARSLLHGALGAPGTYEKSYEDFVKANRGLFREGPGGSLIPRNAGNLFYDKEHPELRKLRGAISPSKGLSYEEAVARRDYAAIEAMHIDADQQLKAHSLATSRTIPHPGKILSANAPTREFRLVSFLTAQADQLARREGPLYESLTQSVLGPIYQGAAQLTRESAVQISRMVARGGSARRAGLAEALKMRAQENINRDRANNVFQAKLALEQFAIQNAKSQLAFNQAWIAGLPGINDAFVGLQTNLANFYNSTIVPTTIGVAGENFNSASAVIQMQMEEDNAKFNRIMGGIIAGAGLGAAAFGGPAAAGATSGFGSPGFFGTQQATRWLTSPESGPRTDGPIFGGGYRTGTGG